MKKNSYMALLLALLMVATLVGCSSGVQNGTSDKPSDTTSNQTILQEATEWFKEQTTYYEIISSEVCGEQIIFLTGTKNPGTDDYQNLQAFVVKQTDRDYEVAAMKDGERGVSAGFSAHVLATDALTIVFGDNRLNGGITNDDHQFERLLSVVHPRRIHRCFPGSGRGTPHQQAAGGGPCRAGALQQGVLLPGL